MVAQKYVALTWKSALLGEQKGSHRGIRLAGINEKAPLIRSFWSRDREFIRSIHVSASRNQTTKICLVWLPWQTAAPASPAQTTGRRPRLVSNVSRLFFSNWDDHHWRGEHLDRCVPDLAMERRRRGRTRRIVHGVGILFYGVVLIQASCVLWKHHHFFPTTRNQKTERSLVSTGMVHVRRKIDAPVDEKYSKWHNESGYRLRQSLDVSLLYYLLIKF